MRKIHIEIANNILWIFVGVLIFMLGIVTPHMLDDNDTPQVCTTSLFNGFRYDMSGAELKSYSCSGWINGTWSNCTLFVVNTNEMKDGKRINSHVRN